MISLFLAPNFKWNNKGLFEYDIRLNSNTRRIVFGDHIPNPQYNTKTGKIVYVTNPPDVQYSMTRHRHKLWRHGIIPYTFADSISKCLFDLDIYLGG